MNAKYEELSRRGLIKLGHDYDRDNNDALQQYLGAAQAQDASAYEEVRPVEQIIERADVVAEKLSGAGSQIAYGLLDKMTDKLTAFVDGMADDIADASDLTGEAAEGEA